jgi:hypothetical protein
VVDKKTKEIICCTSFAEGICRDYKLFKLSDVRFKSVLVVEVDAGFLGIVTFHVTSVLPKKKLKKHPLSREDKLRNRVISRDRVVVEHVIGFVKRFKIVADKYCNRRKRFSLRFNLFCGICNYDRK